MTCSLAVPQKLRGQGPMVGQSQSGRSSPQAVRVGAGADRGIFAKQRVHFAGGATRQRLRRTFAVRWRGRRSPRR